MLLRGARKLKFSGALPENGENLFRRLGLLHEIKPGPRAAASGHPEPLLDPPGGVLAPLREGRGELGEALEQG